MMIMGFTGLLRYIEERHGTLAVRARALNQDSLESLFGHLRFLCGGGSDPNIFKAVHALPTVEAQRKIKQTTARWRSTNLGKQGGGGGHTTASLGSAWLEAHRIRLPAPAEFARLCAAARLAKQPGHHVYWQTLRQLVQQDERKCQTVRAGHRMLPWLKMSQHVNKTGFSRMRVGLATAVVGVRTGRALQLSRLGMLNI